MTLQERISKLSKVRRILNNYNYGTPIDPTDMVLAEDLLDMVVDDMIDERFKKGKTLSNMTIKQKEYIEFIEDFSGIPFKGNPNNNSDIAKYINANKEIAHLNSLSNWELNYL